MKFVTVKVIMTLRSCRYVLSFEMVICPCKCEDVIVSVIFYYFICLLRTLLL
jgi:hypothetical protein